MHAVSGTGQIGSTSGKCWFVGRFIVCTVHKMLLRLPSEGKEMVRACGTYGEQEGV